MSQNWYLIFSYALLESFIIAICLTGLMRVLALRWGIVDQPGDRKMHSEPVPLLGGVAIYLTFNIVILLNLGLLMLATELGFVWLQENVWSFLGPPTLRLLFGIFAGAFIIFLLGIVDDIKILSAEVKLVGQVAAALILVVSGIRLDIFLEPIIGGLPLIDRLSETQFQWFLIGVSGLVTIIWVVAITNAANFLDNMDGLCGGVSGIAALSFFLCVLPQQEYFLCVLLMVFAGSVAGFLYHNLNPARIFMGDAGSMFCGFILATVPVLGTFYTPSSPSRIAVAAPLLALSVFLFDALSVIVIRIRNGESIMKGDKRHFSHRLVELGMTPRQAVEFIFLVAAVTGLGGALLSQVGVSGTLVILAQTTGIFLLIVLLMNAVKTSEKGPIEQEAEEEEAEIP
ncbi:MAG: undecaprenyl/decaprenyl-phosphate alpha-N-acetylglucosaminyl 1-phosphate transferase [Candidatus Hydrogenedentes bacterium]|nr:undecaprenyl/decaprenyl-phosphate alpha-N-acetylglucosaminyl 1-phosphate transferase [Candidatus Hydrogenedentota bacterium]